MIDVTKMNGGSITVNADLIETVEERRQLLHLDNGPMGAVCAAFWHATSTRCSVDVHWKGKPKRRKSADQSTNIIEFCICVFSFSASLQVLVGSLSDFK